MADAKLMALQPDQQHLFQTIFKDTFLRNIKRFYGHILSLTLIW